jgi:hypothetical protein
VSAQPQTPFSRDLAVVAGHPAQAQGQTQKRKAEAS